VFFTVIFVDYFDGARAPTLNRSLGPVSGDAREHRAGDRARVAAVGVTQQNHFRSKALSSAAISWHRI
jgi:hypothetical protein